jgi:CoA:oxalate CoA-transferase
MKPLQHLRILELCHMVSGPYAGVMLADLGAQVVKVEPPLTGERTREILADDPLYNIHGMGAYFITNNRNKQSITLNLKDPRGVAIFHDLAKQADVVLDNFSAGVTTRLGIDHAVLSAINPRLITCAITGFGGTGPGRDWPAFDIVAQAMSGEMSITGEPEGQPMRSGIPIADLASGLMATIGILAGLLSREQTGHGQHIDIAMLDTMLSLQNYAVTMYKMSGIVPKAEGNAHAVHVPYNTFRAQDGYLIIATLTNAGWESVAKALALETVDTLENKLQAGRIKNRHAIEAAINKVLSQHPRAYWLEKLRAAHVPCASVDHIGEAAANPQALARQMIALVEHPQGGQAYVPGNPVKLSDHQQTYAPPPLLGQHTELVLHNWLGKTEQELVSLRVQGVI